MKILMECGGADPTGPDFIFWCPGCQCGHGLWFTRKNRLGCLWKWNSDANAPTVTPSILMSREIGAVIRCHLFIENGSLKFCTDCEHPFAGKTVQMEPFGD